jgi:protein associated with RNAse G/E
LSNVITVNSRKFDGSIRRTWTCRLIEQKGPLLVFEGVFDSDVRHNDLGFIRRGTISYEYYWLDRWYNVFRFHEPEGELRNYYCNINMPPIFVDGVLDYVDLDLDVLVWKDFSYEILDREEFEENAAKYGYSEELRNKVEASLKEITELIDTRSFPFEETPAI